MCIGIAIIGIVPVDGGQIKFYGKNENSSHDELLSEFVPVELHNRSFKIEYIFPSTIRLDAPDEVCQNQSIEFGIADMQFGKAVLKSSVAILVWQWISENSLHHDNATLQGADLRGANLWGANLQGADLREANLQGAYLRGAYLRGAYLQGADLQGATMPEGWTP